MSAPAILHAARAAYAAGLCVLPVAEGGSKRPDVPTWRPFLHARPTAEQRRAYSFARRSGYGVIAGAVSGWRESWDFDCAETYAAFVAAAGACGLGEVVQRIRAGYEDQTPNDGRRWIVTYPKTVEWRDCTLARRPGRDGEPKIKTLIELPTFAVLAPSNGAVHPSGRPYVRLSGGFDTIASYDADEREALLELARSFDGMPRRGVTPAPSATRGVGDRPGDRFNQSATWPAILEPAGWTLVYTQGEKRCWRRPGKATGISATTNYHGSDLLYVFTTSTEFDSEKSYSKFAAYAVLNHGGDFHAAAKALAAEGFGDRSAPRPGGALTLAQDGEETGARVVCLADVQAESVGWIWPNRIARGKLALLIGDPGVGKSYLTLDAAARLSRAREWPGGAAGVLGNTVLLSAEDGLADTIRPRLDALGADMARVYSLEAIRDARGERGFSLDTDLPQLEAVVKERDAALVAIDPLSAYFGNGDSYKDTDVRQVLGPVAKLAERTGVAILGVVHLTKATDRRALYRALGGIGFVAAARLVLGVAKDPDDDGRRLFFPVKSNLCPPAPVLAYRFLGGHLTWDPDPVQGVHADQLLGAGVADTTERQEAVLFLQQILADGAMRADQVYAQGEANGFSKRTLNRAKRKAGADSCKVGFRAGVWHWFLSSKNATLATKDATKDATGENLATFEDEAIKSSDFSRDLPKDAKNGDVAPFGDAVAFNGASSGRPGAPDTAVPDPNRERFEL